MKDHEMIFRAINNFKKKLSGFRRDGVDTSTYARELGSMFFSLADTPAVQFIANGERVLPNTPELLEQAIAMEVKGKG